MKEVEIWYYYNDVPYNETAGLFDMLHFGNIKEDMRRKLRGMFDEISSQKGWLKVEIWNDPKNSDNISYKVIPQNVTLDLNMKILQILFPQ